MASHVTGYDDERFEHVVSQSFHCIICTNVFKDPVMCRHNEHLFCRACITIHLTNSQTCPTCMEPLTVDTLTQAPRGVRNILAELKIRCEFFGRGCREFVELGNLERHVADCGFAPAICSNQGCQLEVNKQDLARHETVECELRRVECHSCSKLGQEMDAVKVSLAALNEKLDRNEKQMCEKLQRNEVNLKAVEQNLVAKAHMVQEQFNQGLVVELRGSLNQITKQLEVMTQHASHQVQSEQEEMKKDIAEADVLNIELMVVVAGGEDRCGELNSVEMFSLSTQTWTPLQPMKERRSGVSLIFYNNQVVAMGGHDNNSTTKSMERLSTNAVHTDQSLTWEKLTAKLPGRLQGHSTIEYNGRLIVIGGYDMDIGVCSHSITEVSLASPYATKLLAAMPQRRCFYGVAIFGDKVVVVGGRSDVDISLDENGIHTTLLNLSSVVMYDITKNEFRELAPIPYPVSEMAAVKWGDDNVMIIGGAESTDEPLNKVLIYNVKTQKSHMLPDMKYKRAGCVAAVVRDTVIVMGGVDESGNSLKSVECFRFDRYSWEELPDMHQCRVSAAAVVC